MIIVVVIVITAVIMLVAIVTMVHNFIIRIIGDHVGQLIPLVLGYNGWVRLERCADVTKMTLIINNPGLCDTLVFYY